MRALCLALLAAGAVAIAAARDVPLSPEELARVKAAEAARVAAVGKVYGTVVAVYGQSRARGGGSAVLFDPAGFALTNYHVVRAAGRKGKAGLADGKLYDWEVCGIDPGGDLAVIRLSAPHPFPAAPLGDSRAVRVGDWAMAMGNPFNLAEDQKPTVTLGIVSGIERFQPGRGGGRTLVYGNCIQIDSSINPGNSGGPLFDLRGRLIGINGRGSFEERGRVNVGVGYAVSVEQAKNFLPDLLATKTCQHATLDATFYDHEGQVLCERVNDAAEIARLGLRPGDRLLAFDGTPVRTANHFLNLISTYPARWPVAVAFARDGQRRTVWLRLPVLPYRPTRPRPQVRPRIVPPKGHQAKGKEKQPKAKERPKSPPRPAPPPMVPGKIANKKLNRAACSWLLGRWAKSRAAVAKALSWDETVVEDGKPVGRQRVLLAADGRFRVHVVQGYDGAPKGTAWGFDGTHHWRREPGAALELQARPERLESIEAAVWRALPALAASDPLAAFKSVELEGGDRAQHQRAFRLRIEPKSGRALVLWFSLFGPDGAIGPRLLKAAWDSPKKGADAAVTFGHYRPVGGLPVPHRRAWVAGLDEQPKRQFVATAVRPLDALPAGALAPTAGAKE